MSELVLTEKEVEFIVDSIGDKIGHYSSLNQHVHKSIKCIEWNIKRVINKKCVSVWYF